MRTILTHVLNLFSVFFNGKTWTFDSVCKLFKWLSIVHICMSYINCVTRFFSRQIDYHFPFLHPANLAKRRFSSIKNYKWGLLSSHSRQLPSSYHVILARGETYFCPAQFPMPTMLKMVRLGEGGTYFFPIWLPPPASASDTSHRPALTLSCPWLCLREKLPHPSSVRGGLSHVVCATTVRRYTLHVLVNIP